MMIRILEMTYEIWFYKINDCNSVTLDTGRYHKSEFFLDHNRLRQVGPESFDYY